MLITQRQLFKIIAMFSQLLNIDQIPKDAREGIHEMLQEIHCQQSNELVELDDGG